MTQFSFKKQWGEKEVLEQSITGICQKCIELPMLVIEKTVCLTHLTSRVCSSSNYKFLLQVGKFIQCLSTFFGGFIIHFTKGWRLALVLSASLPPLVIGGGYVAIILSKMSSYEQITYAEAGNVVEQTLGSIRTVKAITVYS